MSDDLDELVRIAALLEKRISEMQVRLGEFRKEWTLVLEKIKRLQNS